MKWRFAKRRVRRVIAAKMWLANHCHGNFDEVGRKKIKPLVQARPVVLTYGLAIEAGGKKDAVSRTRFLGLIPKRLFLTGRHLD